MFVCMTRLDRLTYVWLNQVRQTTVNLVNSKYGNIGYGTVFSRSSIIWPEVGVKTNAIVIPATTDQLINLDNLGT